MLQYIASYASLLLIVCGQDLFAHSFRFDTVWRVTNLTMTWRLTTRTERRDVAQINEDMHEYQRSAVLMSACFLSTVCD